MKVKSEKKHKLSVWEMREVAPLQIPCILKEKLEYYQKFHANKLVRFLEKHKLSKFCQEATDNVKEIEFYSSKHFHEENCRPEWLHK